MNQIEQGKLFIATQRRYRGWAVKQVSGYVHGVVDGLNRDEPQEVYVRRLREPQLDLYVIGYALGFADAQGADAAFDLAQQDGIFSKAIAYRWWEKSEIPS